MDSLRTASMTSDMETSDDLSALAWVHDELRRSLDAAHKALRRFVKDTEAMAGSDVDAVDPVVLRTARQQIHQGVGALELVGLPAAAMLLRASESAVQCYVGKPHKLNTLVVDDIERASFALLDYLSRMLAGKPVSALSLFPQYRAVQEAAGANRVHPADLWAFDWQWRELPADVEAVPRAPDAATHVAFERQLLALMRLAPAPAMQRLSDICSGLGAGSTALQAATLWKLAAAVFEAQAQGLLKPDVFSKRVASRLLAQLRIVEQGDGDVSERLAQDLLFFCAQAGSPGDGRVASRLASVRQAYGLTHHVPTDYSSSALGRFDPAWISQARKRVTAAKESWSAVAGGELHRLTGLGEQSALVGESLKRLFRSGEALAHELQQAVAQTQQAGSVPPAPLAMEVATALLYVEASLEDAAFDSPEEAVHVQRLAERIASVGRGQPAQPLEGWMGDLYRRVSDRQTMGSVVQELRVSLSEVERLVDQFFRNPADHAVLIAVPHQLSAMRGVLSVLGMDHACATLLRMRDDVDGLMSTEVDPARVAQAGVFDRLAGNLGALGFLIDMLNVQPQLAKSQFTFDASAGTLNPVMGRIDQRPRAVAHAAPAAAFVEAGLIEQAQMLAFTAVREDVSLAEVSRDLERLSYEAHVADQPSLAATVLEAQNLIKNATDEADVTAARGQLSEALVDFVSTASEPVGLEPEITAPRVEPMGASEPVAIDLAEDDEMREVFLEEAREVLHDAETACADLSHAPDDLATLTTVRRAFHTLKGSSRMVGLKDFGDAAWACEQLYNTRLAEQQPADDALLEFTGWSLGTLSRWIDDIALRRDSNHSAAQIQAAALTLDKLAPALESDAADLVPAPVASVDEPFFELDLSLLDEPLPALPDDLVVSLDLDAAAAESMFDHFDAQPRSSAGDSVPAELPVVHELADLPLDMVDVDLGAFDLDLTEPVPVAVAEVADAAEAPANAYDEEEQVKLVGPLRIGIPLFNIYLNEADELSRRLTTEVSEWSMELHRPVGETAIALAHSLAGSSATVGFMDLSHLARSVENALTRSQAIGHGNDEEGRLFVHAAEEVRRLLHQFAAGFLKEPQPELLQRLLDHEITSARRLEASTAAHDLVEEATDAGALDTQISTPMPLFEAAAPAEPEHAPQVTAFAVDAAANDTFTDPAALVVDTGFGASETRFDPLGVVELTPFISLPPSAVSAHAVRHDVPDLDLDLDLDDDLDSVDALDAELFPIFEEEGEELLPQLSAKLRDWARQPSDPSHATAGMRTLHTLKGGARLAGAMRLGEMAHRLENRIERLLAQEHPDAAEVEALQVHSDALSQVFGALRRPDLTPRVDADAQDVAAAELTVTEPMPVLHAEPEPSVPAEVPETPLEHAVEAEVQPEVVHAAQAVTQPLIGAEAGHTLSPAELPEIDWSPFLGRTVAPRQKAERSASASTSSVRVRAPLLDRLVNQAGEVSITRSRIEVEVATLKGSLTDLTDNLERLRGQLRDIELQAETQMSSRLEAAKAAAQSFDPLEFDRFTRFQELTRMMAESVNDVATVQRTLQRTLENTEDELAAQARLTRDLQDDLLRTRMVEFEGLSDRLYRVVRQAAKETGKQVRLDIVGGSIEVDRGVLDRMTGSFEHLLRNSVTHGVESPAARVAAGKDPIGSIVVAVSQDGNEVAVEFRDDGTGLDLQRIRDKAIASGLLDAASPHSEAELAKVIFTSGFSTADKVTELAGRGIGMDVVRSEVNAMGGRIETSTAAGQGTAFKLVLPLTTAVTQVVMLRCGDVTVAVPSTLVEAVRRAKEAEIDASYLSGAYTVVDVPLQFFWLGALLQQSPRSFEPAGRSRHVVVIRSAQQRIALHVDEVIGNQEVVVKNLGPQLSRVPGLAGMTLLPSGAVALIYNPVALATLYGDAARAATYAAMRSPQSAQASAASAPVRLAPLVLVVDDSLTVRRVTQRLLLREGYRVVLAKDGLDALERLAEERPQMVLSDIEMPRMDGFDLVRNIRGDARLRDLPVIMITSRIAQKHRDYAAELGVDHYLGKPYSEEDLLALIGRYTSHESLA